MLPLRDLLGDQPAADKLDIKMNPDGSGQLYVPGLTRVAVRTVDDVNQVPQGATLRPLDFDVESR